MKPETHPAHIRINDYSYELPEERIAQFPLAQRDQAKLLLYRKHKTETGIVKDLPAYLPKGTVMVFNSSKVIPARLHFSTPSGKTIEIFCLEPATERVPSEALMQPSPQSWNCLVGNLKSWKTQELERKQGDQFLKARLEKKEQGFAKISFSWTAGITFAEILQGFGAMPIPPYLNRDSEPSDRTNYQTLYASQEGSVAAPTAGLHFTEELLKNLNESGVASLYLNLHVGAGTFKPVKSEQLAGHEMHEEWMDVPISTIQKLSESTQGTILAVGTTSLRSLESLYWMGVKLLKKDGLSLEELSIGQWDVYDAPDETIPPDIALKKLLDWMKARASDRLVCKTGIMIAPPYRMRLAGALLTNFHQPRSTLLLLVAAAIGEAWKDVYKLALENDFRFLSFGDAMLLEWQTGD